MHPGSRRGGMGLGVLLLGWRVAQMGFDYIPPVTLALTGLQTALYVGLLSPPWTSTEVCLNAYYVLVQGDYRRLLLAALEHSSDMHLYYNMASLLMKGRTLEMRQGSRLFLVTVLVLTLGSSLCYVGLMEAVARYYRADYRQHCAIGFSGVLFAMKVINTHHTPSGFDSRSSSYVLGMRVSMPSRYAVWIELLVIHFLVPRSSFAGHLAGILVGLAYVTGRWESTFNSFTRGFVGIFSGVGGRGDDDDNSRPDVRYSRPEQDYRPYSRQDFNPARNFNPIFQETSTRRSAAQTTRGGTENVSSSSASYTYASGTAASAGYQPSAPEYPGDAALLQEELRQRRLRRFQ